MASSLISNDVEEPPQPGGTLPREFVTASFSTSTNVASLAHSFSASFSTAPRVEGTAVDVDDDLTVWISSNSASGATINVRSSGAATASINAWVTFVADRG